jgi:methanogenic corrinoid protein MtbC1
MMIDTVTLKQMVGELDEDRVNEMLDQFIASNPAGEETRRVIEACRQGMEIVGSGFEEGEYFVGDLIFAGELLTAAMGKLKPAWSPGAGGDRGTLVLGTVAGDIHDIGKNIFGCLAEAAGFRVIDIGIDQSPAAFVAAVKEHRPAIVGLSGVLTLSVDSMKLTIEALMQAGCRDALKIAIGGNAVNAEACKYVGADGWSKNAAEAVKMCGEWLG